MESHPYSEAGRIERRDFPQNYPAEYLSVYPRAIAAIEREMANNYDFTGWAVVLGVLDEAAERAKEDQSMTELREAVERKYRDPKSFRRMTFAEQTCSNVGGHMDPYAADLHTDIKAMREQFDDSVILHAASSVLRETCDSWYADEPQRSEET